ncbi:hypothetical protein OY671_010822, partial [Metschnikowia pulcherrima]
MAASTAWRGGSASPTANGCGAPSCGSTASRRKPCAAPRAARVGATARKTVIIFTLNKRARRVGSAAVTHPPPVLDWTVPAATPAMSSAGGTLRFEREERMSEDSAPGSKLGVVSEGESRYRVPGAPAAQVSGPSSHSSSCRDPS